MLTGRALGYRALTGLCEEMRLSFERVCDRFSPVVSSDRPTMGWFRCRQRRRPSLEKPP